MFGRKNVPLIAAVEEEKFDAVYNFLKEGIEVDKPGIVMELQRLR
ncbi:hypothetical protein [Bacillus safensis]